MSSSSIVLPSISLKKASFDCSEFLRNSNCSSFVAFRNGIRGFFGGRNFDGARVCMSVSVGSQTVVNDALFSDYEPTSAFLFPGQPPDCMGSFRTRYDKR